MATFTKHLLSGSTNGKQIKVAATATPGTLIHTAVAGTDDMDEIYLYATNNNASTSVLLTVEWGGVTAPDDLIKINVPASSSYSLVMPGLLLQNSLVVRAFADTANTVLVSGYVNRITA